MSRSDYITNSNKTANRFSDLPNSFASHPNTNDLTVVREHASVRQSMFNLINTDRYERLMQPSIASNISKLLFEPIDNVTTQSLKQSITNLISNHEPRVIINQVIVDPNKARNSYIVTIEYYLINTDQPATAQYTLKRIK